VSVKHSGDTQLKSWQALYEQNSSSYEYILLFYIETDHLTLRGCYISPRARLFFSHEIKENKNQIISVLDTNKRYFVKYITTTARWKLQNHIFRGMLGHLSGKFSFFYYEIGSIIFFQKKPITPLKVKWSFPNHMFTTVWNYLLTYTCICVLLHLIDWLIDWSQVSAIEDILRRERYICTNNKSQSQVRGETVWRAC